MKLRDSGMPEESYWETLVDPAGTLARLGIDTVEGDAIEFGCGYGTFTLPLARVVRGTIWALDIDPGMVERVRVRVTAAGLTNVVPAVRDLFESGTGRPQTSVVVVTIFNLLHCEEPERLLAEASRVLVPGGTLALTHWRWDASTPRGPDLSIRPRPEQLRCWAEAEGFRTTDAAPRSLAPYHYGWRLTKPG